MIIFLFYKVAAFLTAIFIYICNDMYKIYL